MNPPFGLIANLPPPRHTRYKSGMGTSTCAICAKHRGTGPLVSPRIFEDDFVVVSHRPPPPHGRSVPGYVFIETRRHVSGLPSLSEPEALAIAHAVWCVSRALDSELTPEFVFSAIAGLSVPHFHQHVFVRPFGAPSSVSWNDVDSWDDAPRVDEVELTLLCRRIALGFEDEQ